MGYKDLNKNEKTDWVTPKDCRDLLKQLGVLTLDVCTKAENHMEAKQFYTPRVNGLVQSWLPNCGGITWCNHPWSRIDTPLWINRAVEEGNRLHREGWKDNELVLLGPSRPDTRWYRALWSSADAIYFWQGRMTFIDPDTGMPAVDKHGKPSPVPVPVQLSYWGHRPQHFIDVFMQQGGCYAIPPPPF